MDSTNENDVIECDVCFDKRPVYIPLITCGHSKHFCEECIKKWLAQGHPTCPKCRTTWSIQDYLKKTNQHHLNITNVVLSTTQNIHSSPLSTADRLVHKIFMCCSIGLLLGLIIYPTIKQI